MEIGSEFSIDPLLACEVPNKNELSSDFDFLGKSLYLLSGRTAIDCICRDILSAQQVKKVFMPAYCCSSMQQAFISHGIHIVFYDVVYTGTSLHFDFDTDQPIEILYLNNYFGFHHSIDVAWVQKLREQGTIVIYDKTHSLFQENDPWLEIADYVFCSLRKWFAITSGAVLSKRRGEWNLSLKDCSYVEVKRTAQYNKHRYLQQDLSVCKSDFYPYFGVFDTHLKEDYVAYQMDGVSLQLLKNMDLFEIQRKRKENARFYYNELQGVKGVRFMFEELQEDIVPLFVPILLDNAERRAAVKTLLVKHQLYCPSHWPKYGDWSESMQVNQLYDTEISLICDQRYSPGQLKAITHLLKTL